MSSCSCSSCRSLMRQLSLLSLADKSFVSFFFSSSNAWGVLVILTGVVVVVPVLCWLLLHWYGDVFCGLLRLADCWRCIALVQNFRFWLVLGTRNDARIYVIVLLFRKNLLVSLFLFSTFFTMPDGITLITKVFPG